jgi:hypothetical protein
MTEINDLNKTSILLLVRISKPGNRRKVPSNMVTVDADNESISVGKELLDCPELGAITTLDGKIRTWIYVRSLPSGVLKEGVYRLPLSLVDEVDRELKNFQQQRMELIDQFIQVYPQKADEARTRLRVLYDPSDYPPAEQIRGAFDLQWRYLSLDIPNTISNVLIQQEREKAAKDVAAEMDEIRLALRESFADLISHAANSLTVGPDNKPKIFRDSLVNNLEQFFHYFDQKNIVNDEDLAALVKQARSIMQGVSPDDLRENISLRKDIQQAMNSIKQTITEGVMLKPGRRFSFAPQKEVANAL